MTGGFVFFGDTSGLTVLRRLSLHRLCCAVTLDTSRVPLSEASDLGVPVLAHPTRDDRQTFELSLHRLEPSLGVICSYNRILWPALLKVFPCGVVNLHNGRLPEYRGANVLQWAIINGEPATAATLHYVDEGIDTGPVIDAVEVAITEADTALTLRERLVITDIALLERWLPQLLGGPAAAVPQEAARARTWPRRRPQDGAIDWNQTDRQIRDLTRALVPPWPGAWYVDRDGTTTVVSQVLEPDDIKRLRQEQSCQPCQPDFDAIASAGARER